MTLSYRVVVNLGALTWDISHGDGALPDEDDVLDNLSFGWSMPEGLWPMQPEPMTATLALNVPTFTSDVHDLVEGDTCSILVFLTDEDGFHETQTAAFYGRITDLQARPRSRRDGVTLSVVAVDYTVDLVELPTWAPSGVTDIPTTLEQLWDDRIATAFPTWPGPFEFGTPDTAPVADAQDVPTRIANELAQAVAPIDATPTHRLILAPLIDDTTNTLDATQAWTFDRVYKPPNTDAYSIACDRIEKDSFEWLYSKQSWPNYVEVIGPSATETASHAAPTPRIARLTVTLVDSADVADVAAFYLPDPTPSGWRLNTFRFHATRGSGIVIDDAPFQAFPQLHLLPDTAERSSCYGQPIVITDVPNHLNPLADGEPEETSHVEGRLTAASVTVQGGHVFFDFQLRQTAI